MRKIIVGTKNRGKFREIEASIYNNDLELVFPEDIEIYEEPDENGKSFHENAEIKAKYYFEKSGIPCISDDSGIIVDELKNELGIHTRRWGAGENASDEKWLRAFLQEMKCKKNKSAKFVAVIAFFDGENLEFFEGETSGIITEKPLSKIEEGVPLSSVFLANGADKVFSAMTKQEKNKYSHRGKAVEKFKKFLFSKN